MVGGVLSSRLLTRWQSWCYKFVAWLGYSVVLPVGGTGGQRGEALPGRQAGTARTGQARGGQARRSWCRAGVLGAGVGVVAQVRLRA